MRIRPALPSDAAAIAELASELGYPSSTAEIRQRLERLLGRNAYFIVVAERESRIVGWVAAERRLLLESGERADLAGLVVTADARRAGIGRALVAEAEDWARRNHLEAIVVRSSITRPESHPFYESLGYVRVKTQHAYRKRLADR